MYGTISKIHIIAHKCINHIIIIFDLDVQCINQIHSSWHLRSDWMIVAMIIWPSHFWIFNWAYYKTIWTKPITCRLKYQDSSPLLSFTSKESHLMCFGITLFLWLWFQILSLFLFLNMMLKINWCGLTLKLLYIQLNKLTIISLMRVILRY